MNPQWGEGGSDFREAHARQKGFSVPPASSESNTALEAACSLRLNQTGMHTELLYVYVTFDYMLPMQTHQTCFGLEHTVGLSVGSRLNLAF